MILIAFKSVLDSKVKLSSETITVIVSFSNQLEVEKFGAINHP